MKNLHVLPTDSFNPLGQQIWRRKNGGLFKPTNANPIADNLEGNVDVYITSDEEIKEGVKQWYLDKFLNKPYNSGGAQYSSKQDVIIMTTDRQLIEEGVQAITDEFLEWFVKNPSCEEVEVKCYSKFNDGDFTDYKIIIPKEEPRILTVESFNKAKISYKEPSLEITVEEVFSEEKRKGLKEFIDKHKLEEAAGKWVFETNGHKWSNNDDTAGDNFGSFKAGAEWQASRGYSEEEVNEIIAEAWNSCEDNEGETFTEVRKRILEQFKKK